MADGDLTARKQALEEQIQKAQEALTRIQALSDTYWHALDSSCQAMQGGAWFGPTARRFGARAEAHQERLRAELSKAVTSAQGKIAGLRMELAGLR